MEVTVHLDGNPAVREEGFFESKVAELEHTIKALQFDNAELVRTNDELAERVKKLASRQPTWPKGYRPRFKKRS
jgi:hypothetical protein|tara:strand:+ start:103 stop:324 length:222 start_codon:yes stop_codon:yes gene_type:complete